MAADVPSFGDDIGWGILDVRDDQVDYFNQAGQGIPKLAAKADHVADDSDGASSEDGHAADDRDLFEGELDVVRSQVLVNGDKLDNILPCETSSLQEQKLDAE